MELPDGMTDAQQVITHFSECFYDMPGDDDVKALTTVMKRYQERLQSNTVTAEESKAGMKGANPRFILRNYLLHQAIEELQSGEDGLFLKLQQAIKEPYSGKHDAFFRKRPDWAGRKAGCSMLSCSS
jgi:uncharacterized protein YdiU (UPF0061 family)